MDEKKKQLADLMVEIKALSEKGTNNLSEDERKDLGVKVLTARGLRTDIETSEFVADTDEWSGKAAPGGVPLVPGEPVDNRNPDDIKAHLEAVQAAGYVITDTKRAGRKITMDVIDLEAIMDHKTWETISSRDYKSSFDEYVRKGEKTMSSNATKVLNEGADGSGGFLLPEEYLNQIIQKEPTPLSVSGRVTQLNTMRDQLVIPRVNYTTDDLYTTGIRATWTGEQPGSATSARVTEPVFGQTRISVFTAMLSMTLTRDMLEDSAFNVLGWSSGKFSETIDLLRENMALTGSGINQPFGILANPNGTNQPAVITSGQASSITADALEATAFAIPPQYDAASTFVFNKLSTAKTIADMKDGQGRFLWGAGMQDSGMVPGWKDRKLWGYDVLYSEFMPNIGTSTYPVIFGDLKGYYQLNRVGFSVEVLREIYAETNQVLLLGRVRFGGQVAEEWKLKALQCHV